MGLFAFKGGKLFRAMVPDVAGAQPMSGLPSLPVRSGGAGLPQQFAQLNRLSVWAGAHLDHNPGPAKRAMALGFEGRRVTPKRPVPGGEKARLIGKRFGGSGPETARDRIMGRMRVDL